MKRIYILLIFSLFLISGCENKEEKNKNEYIAMKNQTFDEKNYNEKSLPVDIVTTIERIDEEDKKVKNAQIESPIKKVGDYLIEKLNKYKYLLILDFVIFLLLTIISPLDGDVSCIISFKNVLLPAPEAPTIKTNSPLSMCRFTS